MTTQVIFNIDKKLKQQAMKKAQGEGMALSYILQSATKAYVKGVLGLELVKQPEFNAKTRRELDKALKDIKEGKNLVGPFKSVAEMKKYLTS